MQSQLERRSKDAPLPRITSPDRGQRRSVVADDTTRDVGSPARRSRVRRNATLNSISTQSQWRNSNDSVLPPLAESATQHEGFASGPFSLFPAGKLRHQGQTSEFPAEVDVVRRRATVHALSPRPSPPSPLSPQSSASWSGPDGTPSPNGSGRRPIAATSHREPRFRRIGSLGSIGSQDSDDADGRDTATPSAANSPRARMMRRPVAKSNSMASLMTDRAKKAESLRKTTAQRLATDLLNLHELFQNLHPDKDGLVPLSVLSAAIHASRTEAAGSPLRTVLKGKTKRDEFGRAAMNFEDLVKIKYPYTTAEDMVTVREAMAKAQRREQICNTLSEKAVREAKQVFDSRMDPTGEGCTEVDEETLELGLAEEYPELESPYQLLKTLDSDVRERLRTGGTMKKNEFVIWHATNFNPKKEGGLIAIWTPGDDESILDGTRANTRERMPRRSKTSANLLSPKQPDAHEVLSGYVSRPRSLVF